MGYLIVIKVEKYVGFNTRVAIVTGIAGAMIKSSTSMFIVSADGSLYERKWNHAWIWTAHGHPLPRRGLHRHASNIQYTLLPARPAYISETLIVCVLRSGQLAGRVFRVHNWEWEVSSLLYKCMYVCM